LAQDRGGAIKGSRLDLFCGAGQRAEFLAGHLQAQSRVYLLLKK
jgi:membrane-bound lytic murein transglycosylase A